MNCRRLVYIPIGVIALLAAQGLGALQAPDTSQTAPGSTKAGTKKATKKAKKATKDTAEAGGQAAYPATDTGQRTRVKPKKAAVPETSARQAASSTTETTTKEATGRADRMASSTPNTAVPAPAKIVSDSEIAAAKASGMVWVNTGSGTYHKSGRWYGATKQGKFMTEQDAMRAGYHAARGKSQ